MSNFSWWNRSLNIQHIPTVSPDPAVVSYISFARWTINVMFESFISTYEYFLRVFRSYWLHVTDLNKKKCRWRVVKERIFTTSKTRRTLERLGQNNESQTSTRTFENDAMKQRTAATCYTWQLILLLNQLNWQTEEWLSQIIHRCRSWDWNRLIRINLSIRLFHWFTYSMDDLHWIYEV